MGLVIGLSFWESVDGPIIIPALAWLTLPRPRVWMRAYIGIPGLLLGALPWLLSNLRHDWWSLSSRGGSGTYLYRLHGYVAGTFPMMLGLRVPFAIEWVAGRAVSAAVYLLAAAFLVVAAWRWWRQPRSLFPFVVLVYPFFYAADALTSNTGSRATSSCCCRHSCSCSRASPAASACSPRPRPRLAPLARGPRSLARQARVAGPGDALQPR